MEARELKPVISRVKIQTQFILKPLEHTALHIFKVPQQPSIVSFCFTKGRVSIRCTCVIVALSDTCHVGVVIKHRVMN